MGSRLLLPQGLSEYCKPDAGDTVLNLHLGCPQSAGTVRQTHAETLLLAIAIGKIEEHVQISMISCRHKICRDALQLASTFSSLDGYHHTPCSYLQ